MSTVSSIPSRTSAAVVAPSGTTSCALRAALRERASALTVRSERSNYIFSSPLGPGFRDGRQFTLPRFVYFGPHTHEESLRLAFYAGADSRDLRTAFGLLNLVERLALEPDLGQGLNLSFFPLLDATDEKSVDIRELSVTEENWARSDRAEVELLRRDVRQRGYHGFVRLETADVDTLTVQLAGPAEATVPPTGVELVSSEDFAPLEVVWEAANPNSGILALSSDLPFHAFELVIRLPQAWSSELISEAIGLVLRRFIRRYRGIQAYGQHL